jgi:hypothetical protein
MKVAVDDADRAMSDALATFNARAAKLGLTV